MRLIAGPCQHETLTRSAEIAKECKRVCDKYGIDYYFKASFDKANRTSDKGVRGMGMEATLTDFLALKVLLNVKTLTDVHDYVQVKRIEREFKDAVDVYQFMAPWDMKGVLSKCADAKEVWITERGTSFGYNTLVNDFTGINYMLDNFSNVVFDATHSVQSPGGQGSSSGGNRNYVAGLTRAASAMGVSNFFLEVHPDPNSSPSDGQNMIELENFEEIVRDIISYSYTRKI
jgi:2-dehydro-3-deoxyphosphooctonate aldolase (KDO 8-P synthase)